MSSSDLKTVLIQDSRLTVTDELDFGVYKGAQNFTPTIYQAISQSANNAVWNIAVPSETTVLDSRVMWKATITLKISSTATSPAGDDNYLVNYGSGDALAPFPLHQLCSTQSFTFNNNTVSLNTQDCLASILRFNDKRDIMRYNSTTPTMYDTYFNYSDIPANSSKNVLGSYSQSGVDNDFLPRGAYDVIVTSTTNKNDANYGVQQPMPNAGVINPVYVIFTVCEPLLMSPFTFGSMESKGFYGLQNLNAIFNFNSGNTIFRSVDIHNLNASVQVIGVENSSLLFNMLTPHPSTLLPSRNILSYLDMPRYIFTNLPGINAGATQQMVGQNLQLNQVPDKLIIFVRKSMSGRTQYDSDSFLCIDQVNLSFNNSSGLLSNAQKEHLYNYSVSNGSNQSFQEFSGRANITQTATDTNPPNISIPTSGSLLVLQMGKDVQLSDDWYAPSSLGTFNLAVTLSVRNQTSVDLSSNQIEMVVITVNAGCIAFERGTCSTYSGLLTKANVIQASEQVPYSMTDIKRLIGGKGLMSTLNSLGKRLAPKIPGLLKKGLEYQGSENAQKGAKLLGAMGYGYSGAGYSGAGYSGAGKLTNRYV
jgi:hypothetical protein